MLSSLSQPITTSLTSDQQAQLPVIPSNLLSIIHINITHGTILCIAPSNSHSPCHIAIKTCSPNAAKRHFQEKHKLSPLIIQELANFVDQYPFKYDPATVSRPAHYSLPLQHLLVLPAFICTFQECYQSAKNSAGLKSHINTSHNIRGPATNQYVEQGLVQAWRLSPSGDTTWCVVDPAVVNSTPSPFDSTSFDASVFQQQVDELQLLRNNRFLSLPPVIDQVEVTPWVVRTGWKRIYDALLPSPPFPVVIALVQPPHPFEPDLSVICTAWKQLFYESLDRLPQSYDTRTWLSSPCIDTPKHDFLRLESNTLEKYCGIFENFLAYCWRACPTPFNVSPPEFAGLYFNPDQTLEISNMVFSALMSQSPQFSSTPSEKDSYLYSLKAALVRFLYTIFCETDPHSNATQSPLLQYLAFLGIYPAQNRFRTPGEYTPILGAVLYIARLVLSLLSNSTTLSYRNMWLPDGETPISSLPPSFDFQSLRQAYFVTGCCSPTSEIISQLAYGKRICKNTQGSANIHWGDHNDYLVFKGETIYIEKVRSACNSLNLQLDSHLEELTLGVRPVLNLCDLKDSLSPGSDFSLPGYSFLEHVNNKTVCKIDQITRLSHLASTSAGKAVFTMKPNAPTTISLSASRRLLALEGSFLSTLMAATHIQYGQPARARELGSVKVENSQLGLRGIFIINGRIGLVTWYDKARQKRRTSEYVIRLLPDKLSQILAQYLVYVRPTLRLFDYSLSPYLFCSHASSESDLPWSNSELTRALKDSTRLYMDCQLTVQSYRQVSIAVANRLLSLSWDADDDVDDDDHDDDTIDEVFATFVTKQSAHGKPVARNHYAIEKPNFETVTPGSISAYSTVSIKWHKLLQLSSSGISTPYYYFLPFVIAFSHGTFDPFAYFPTI